MMSRTWLLVFVQVHIWPVVTLFQPTTPQNNCWFVENYVNRQIWHKWNRFAATGGFLTFKMDLSARDRCEETTGTDQQQQVRFVAGEEATSSQSVSQTHQPIFWHWEWIRVSMAFFTHTNCCKKAHLIEKTQLFCVLYLLLKKSICQYFWTKALISCWWNCSSSSFGSKGFWICTLPFNKSGQRQRNGHSQPTDCVTHTEASVCTTL